MYAYDICIVFIDIWKSLSHSSHCDVDAGQPMNAVIFVLYIFVCIMPSIHVVSSKAISKCQMCICHIPCVQILRRVQNVHRDRYVVVYRRNEIAELQVFSQNAHRIVVSS